MNFALLYLKRSFDPLIIQRGQLIVKLFPFLLFVLLLTNCKKGSVQTKSALLAQYDTLSATDDSILTALPDTTLPLSSIILDDGENVFSFLQANDPSFLQTYQSETIPNSVINRSGFKTVDGGSGSIVLGSVDPLAQRRLFFSRMTAVGNYLKYRPNWQMPAGATSAAGITSPAQNGLAYSYGSRDLVRQIPPSGHCKSLSIYGLDCSGMIYQMTTSSFLSPVVSHDSWCVRNIFDIDLWNTAFKNTADYDSLIMVDMGDQSDVPFNQIQFGDMVFWVSDTSAHMGFCIGGWLYESGGTGDYPACTNNLNPNKGPKCIPLSGALQINSGQYEIFRVIATSSSNSNNSRSCVFTFTYPQIKMVLGISLTFVSYTGGESNYTPIYNTFPVCKNGNWGNAETGLGYSQIPFTIGYNGTFDTLSAWNATGSLIGFSFTQAAGGQSSYWISGSYVDSCADTNVKDFYISQLFKCP
jgi:hypothetical protein